MTLGIAIGCYVVQLAALMFIGYLAYLTRRDTQSMGQIHLLQGRRIEGLVREIIADLSKE